MKITLASVASILAYIGLPASFVATAMHEPAALSANSSALFQSHAGFIAPLLFVSTVLSVAAILVHHLREEQRLNTFTHLHLRLSTPKTSAVRTLPKARLAKAAAI